MTTATPTAKICTRCGVEKPLAEYHRKAANRDGHRSECKTCRRAQRKTYIRRLEAERIEPAPTDTKPCTRCGETKPLTEYHRDSGKKDGHAAHCKPCTLARRNAYYVANREAVLIQQKTYREENREAVLTRQRVRYEANREQRLTYRKAYRAANREQIAARQKAHREANRERYLARDRAYHAEKWATDAEYRARRKAAFARRYRMLANAKSEPYTREEIFARDGWTCGLCGEPIDPTIRYEDDPRACATIDHIVPLSRGGDDTPANVQAAHGSCNYSKCDRAEDEDRAVAA